MSASELLQFCWSRDLPYSDLVMYGKQFHVKPIPTKKFYLKYCIIRDKQMIKDLSK